MAAQRDDLLDPALQRQRALRNDRRRYFFGGLYG